MILFPENLFSLLIYGALIWTGLGGLVLITLILKDFISGNVW